MNDICADQIKLTFEDELLEDCGIDVAATYNAANALSGEQCRLFENRGEADCAGRFRFQIRVCEKQFQAFDDLYFRDFDDICQPISQDLPVAFADAQSANAIGNCLRFLVPDLYRAGSQRASRVVRQLRLDAEYSRC